MLCQVLLRSVTLLIQELSLVMSYRTCQIHRHRPLQTKLKEWFTNLNVHGFLWQELAGLNIAHNVSLYSESTFINVA